ncbi:SOS response-associated peptidase [Sphingomonas oryzagri]
MCNDYRLEVDIASIAEDFDNLKIKIKMPEGTPNVPAREDINITDVAPIVRAVDGQRGVGELVNRRWSWPDRGKPVYNFRADGRSFGPNRALILTDGYYEFTDPQPGEKRKTKWLFTLKDHDWFCIAGIWRAHPEVGEAFTMLTLEPSQDIARYHKRQIVTLPRDRWAAWLDPSVPAEEVLQVPPEGSLAATQVYPPQAASL